MNESTMLELRRRVRIEIKRDRQAQKTPSVATDVTECADPTQERAEPTADALREFVQQVGGQHLPSQQCEPLQR